MSDYILYGVLIVFYAISFAMNKKKSKKALKIGWNAFKKLMPAIIPMMIFIGITLSVLKPSTISMVLGDSSGFFGILLALSIGSITFMPSFVAFPLGASLLTHGAGYPQIAAFISSLMAVGFSSIALEVKYFGKKVSMLRNTFAVVSSLVFALIVWSVM